MKFERGTSLVRWWFAGTLISLCCACGAGGDGESVGATITPPALAESTTEKDAGGAKPPETDPPPSPPSQEELSEAHWIEGRVIIPPETPADLRIEVVAAGRKFPGGGLHSSPVDPQGGFRVAFARRTRTASVRLESNWLFLPDPARIDLVDLAEPLLLEPRLGGRIEGRACAAEGQELDLVGLAGTMVELSFPPSPETLRARDWEFVQPRNTSLAPDGGFTFDAIAPEGTGALDLRAEGCVPTNLAQLQIEAGRTLEILLPLVPGVTISGRVVDEQGDPIAGASVDQGWTSGVEHVNTWPAPTNEGGEFRLTGLVPGPVKVRAQKTGWVEAELSLDVLAPGQVHDGVVLTMSRGTFVSGRVRWPEGEPAPGAWIEIMPIPVGGRELFAPPAMVIEARAEEDGRFMIGGLNRGPYDVKARARRRDPAPPEADPEGSKRRRPPRVTYHARIENVGGNTSDLDLRLSRGEEISGRVVDGEGHPVRHFVVMAERHDGINASEVVIDLTPFDEMGKTFESEDGSFLLDGYLPGLWTLIASADDYARSEPVQVRVPISDDPPTLVLRPPGLLEGIVVDDRGRPLAGARVIAEREGDGRQWRNPVVTTDGDGGFVIEDLAAGEWAVTAHGVGFAPSASQLHLVTTGRRIGDLSLALRAPGTIRGRVLGFGERPATHVTVEAHRYDPHEVREVRTDAEGHFVVTELAPGEWHVDSPLSAEEIAAEVAPPDEGSWPVSRETTVQLEEGAEASVELRAHRDDSGSAWSGKVPFEVSRPADAVGVLGQLLLAGEPAARANLAITGEHEPSPPDPWPHWTTEHGMFRLFAPSPGTWRVWVRREGVIFSRLIELPDTSDLLIDLEFEAGAIAGRVIDHAGRPVPDAQVWCRAVSEDRVYLADPGSVSTGKDGSYRLEGVRPGIYDVATRFPEPPPTTRNDRVEFWKRGIAVLPGETQAGINLDLEGTAILAGTVVDAAGEPVSRARLCLWREDGSRVLRHTLLTDSDGRFRVHGLPAEALRVTAWRDSAVSRASEPIVMSTDAPAEIERRLVRGTFLRLHVAPTEPDYWLDDVDVRDAAGYDFRRLVIREFPSGDEDDDSGHVRVGPLPPGSYTISYSGDLAPAFEVRIEVTEEAEIPVELPPR